METQNAVRQNRKTAITHSCGSRFRLLKFTETDRRGPGVGSGRLLLTNIGLSDSSREFGYSKTLRPILSARISLPGLKRMVLPGGIATSSPVRGFLPTPLFRGLTINTPNPRSSILSPRFRAFLSELKTDSTAISAFTLVIFNCSETRFTMSCFITPASHKLVQAFYLWVQILSSHFYLQDCAPMIDSASLRAE